jgi:ribulose-5-phosphate 4-epimerase/fuculose-1-phosphate aldolase
MDGSSSVGITASSEVSTHRKVFEKTKSRAILHGHPKFSVIMSMYCNKDCDSRDECHKACPEQRSLCETPIVPGEIGTGPAGIVNTVPRAFEMSDAVIVHGHGVFCIGSKDFNEPIKKMMDIEECCKSEYFNRVSVLL